MIKKIIQQNNECNNECIKIIQNNTLKFYFSYTYRVNENHVLVIALAQPLCVVVKLVVGLMLTRMRVLQRVLELMRMLMLYRRMPRVVSNATGERTSPAVSADHALRIGQLVLLRTKTPEPNKTVLGD